MYLRCRLLYKLAKRLPWNMDTTLDRVAENGHFFQVLCKGKWLHIYEDESFSSAKFSSGTPWAYLVPPDFDFLRPRLAASCSPLLAPVCQGGTKNITHRISLCSDKEMVTWDYVLQLAASEQVTKTPSPQESGHDEYSKDFSSASSHEKGDQYGEMRACLGSAILGPSKPEGMWYCSIQELTCKFIVESLSLYVFMLVSLPLLVSLIYSIHQG